jgi:hypothetical protein
MDPIHRPELLQLRVPVPADPGLGAPGVAGGVPHLRPVVDPAAQARRRQLHLQPHQARPRLLHQRRAQALPQGREALGRRAQGRRHQGAAQLRGPRRPRAHPGSPARRDRIRGAPGSLPGQLARLRRPRFASAPGGRRRRIRRRRCRLLCCSTAPPVILFILGFHFIALAGLRVSSWGDGHSDDHSLDLRFFITTLVFLSLASEISLHHYVVQFE